MIMQMLPVFFYHVINTDEIYTSINVLKKKEFKVSEKRTSLIVFSVF